VNISVAATGMSPMGTKRSLENTLLSLVVIRDAGGVSGGRAPG
jgi:hypothetical protein